MSAHLYLRLLAGWRKSKVRGVFTSRWQPRTVCQQNTAEYSGGTRRFFTGSRSEKRQSTTALHPPPDYLYCATTFTLSPPRLPTPPHPPSPPRFPPRKKRPKFPNYHQQNTASARKQITWFVSKAEILQSRFVVVQAHTCTHLFAH